MENPVISREYIKKNYIHKDKVKESFQNTRNKMFSLTLVSVKDMYWMDTCISYINNLEKEILEETNEQI